MIGGVPYWWRLQQEDCQPGFMPAFRALNMLQPMSLGRLTRIADANAYTLVKFNDFNDSNRVGQGYLPIIHPGFHNVSRQHGDFFWNQFLVLRLVGIKLLLIFITFIILHFCHTMSLYFFVIFFEVSNVESCINSMDSAMELPSLTSLKIIR